MAAIWNFPRGRSSHCKNLSYLSTVFCSSHLWSQSSGFAPHLFLILENWNMCMLLLIPSLVLSWPHFNLERLVNIVFSIAYGVFLPWAYLNASKQTMALDTLATIFKPSVPICALYTRLESHIIHRAKECWAGTSNPSAPTEKIKKGEFVCYYA